VMKANAKCLTYMTGYLSLRIDVFMVMKIHVVLWVVIPLHPEDGGSIVLQEIGT
jgi:hypothetical protein